MNQNGMGSEYKGLDATPFTQVFLGYGQDPADIGSVTHYEDQQ